MDRLTNQPLAGRQRTLIAIFVIALLVRGVFILTLKNGFYFEDSVSYSEAAMNLIQHGEFGEDYSRPPVYPLVLAGIYLLFGPHTVAIRIVQAIMGACLALVIALVAKRMGGEDVGALAGILWSLYPLGVFIAGIVYPTSVVTLLLACAVLCMAPPVGQELGPRRVVLGGLLFGLAALTKPIVLGTVLTTTLWLMYWQRTHRLVLASVFLLGVALSLAPWTVRNLYIHGHAVTVASRLDHHLPQVMQDEKGSKFAAILKHPGALAARFFKNFRRFWELYPTRIQMSQSAYRETMHKHDARIVKKTVFGTTWTSLISIVSVGPVFLFAVLGIGAMGLQKERRRDLSLLCLIILSFAVGYACFYTKMRYRLPVEPYIIMLSAYGLVHVWTMLQPVLSSRASFSPKNERNHPRKRLSLLFLQKLKTLGSAV